jgi:hypothetical protein
MKKNPPDKSQQKDDSPHSTMIAISHLFIAATLTVAAFLAALQACRGKDNHGMNGHTEAVQR